jgi:hypothetical protein
VNCYDIQKIGQPVDYLYGIRALFHISYYENDYVLRNYITTFIL